MEKKLSVVVGQKVYITRLSQWGNDTYYPATIINITPAGFINVKPLTDVPASSRFRPDGIAQASGLTSSRERIDEMPFDERRELIRKRDLVIRANDLIEATHAFPPLHRPTQENVTQRIIDMRAKLDEAAAEIAKIEGK